MRAQIIASDSYANRCTIRYEDDCGTMVERDFFAPAAGGYVKENWSDPRQVCERLASTGNTLLWYPSEGPLSQMIRRERAKALRAERQMWASR